MNKTRTLMTILGILLSAALITVVAGVATSGQESMINTEIQKSGDYDFYFYGTFSQDDIRKMKENRNVKDVYTFSVDSLALLENSTSKYKPYIDVMGANKATFEAFNYKLESGRFPENSSEIILGADFLDSTENTYKIGDEIELKVGNRLIPNNDGTEYEDVGAGATYPYIEGEKFEETGTEKFTIVGILENEGGDMSLYNMYYPSVTAYTSNTGADSEAAYIRVNDDYESNFCRVMAQIIGLDEKLAESIYKDSQNLLFHSDDFEEYRKMFDELEEQMRNSDFDIAAANINSGLLKWKGYIDNEAMSILYGFAAVMIVIIIIASVFIIRNSFAISITEKTKLYGMLSSIGATPHQIRMNVLYEGGILALIGLPLGVGLGVGVTAILIWLCNNILKDALGGITIAFSVPLYAIISAAVLGVVTILFSTITSAIRASRISAVEAIRGNKDIKVSKKRKEKNYKTPRSVNKIFGIGGSIAWKNMKRSRKNYRTTIISIIVSVAVYLTVFSFVEYAVNYVKDQPFYQNSLYNMSTKVNGFSNDGQQSVEEFQNNVERLAHSDGVKSYRYNIESYEVGFNISKDILSDEWQDYLKVSSEQFFDDDGYFSEAYSYPFLSLVAVDDDSFKELCSSTGKSYKECKDKGFIYNESTVYDEGDSSRKRVLPFLKDPETLTLSGTYEEESFIDYEEIEKYENDPEVTIYMEYYNDAGEDISEEEYREEYEAYDKKTGDVHYSIRIARSYDVSVKLAGALPEDYIVSIRDDRSTSNVIVVSMEWLKDNAPWSCSGELYFDAEDPDALEETLLDYMNSENRSINLYDVMNYSRVVNNIRSMILIIQIFIYGFILVIALIGATNIFNTITTNMKLRQKEFAMMRSIGMTKREFNRMIRLESFLYTFKSLFIGIPIGIIGDIVVYNIFTKYSSSETSFMIPWLAILISIFAVLALLWIVMKYSISKVSKQNIIETIRNDNI